MSILLSIISSRVFPYLLAGLAAIALVVAIYLAGVNAERDRQKIEDLQEQTRILQEDIARKKKAAEEDAKQAEEDAVTIAILDAKTKELISELQDPARQCFTADDVDRLRKLWD